MKAEELHLKAGTNGVIPLKKTRYSFTSFKPSIDTFYKDYILSQGSYLSNPLFNRVKL